MERAIIGEKIGMTQVFDENGNRIPITVVKAGPCVVTQIKTSEKDGYDSVQVGFKDIKLKYKKENRASKFNEKPSNITLAMQGHFAKFDVAPKRKLLEFKFENFNDYKVGSLIKADKFKVGEAVDVTGVSKGKGTAGVIKRWNFGRLRESHGTGPCARTGGSIGGCSNPSKVFKGKKMAGHLGNEKTTVINLKIIEIDTENNLIAIRGSIPGPKGSFLVVRDSMKKREGRNKMPKLSVVNMAGEKVKEIELSDTVFSIKPNALILHEVVINHLANRRQGTKSSLTRSEVSGGGRKPWRQKGTGRARQGSTRSVQWRHGGIAFAPKPRDYSYTINKKIKRLAMKSALSYKFLQNNITVVDKIETKEFKTRFFVDMLKALENDKKTLMVLNNSDKKVVKSTNNIPTLKTSSVNILSVYDILNAEKLVLSYDAAISIQEVYA